MRSDVRLDGAPNFRDLGGTEVGGGRLRKAALLRSDQLSRLSDRDRARLRDLELVKVCDLRINEERETHPNRLDPEHLASASHFEIMPGSADRFREEVLAGTLTPASARRAMLDIYRELALEHASDYAELVRVMVEAPAGAVLVHCAAGKDRTGWGIAVLLLAVGASEEAVLRDYLLSGERFPIEREIESSRADWLERGAPRVDPEALRPLYGVDPDYLLAALGAARDRGGGLAGYFREVMGLEPELLEALRARLVSSP